jgi:metallo-beta-lactamase family protein
MIELTFLGAAGTVTGSKTLLQVGDDRLLVDCGLFQGLKQLRLLNWQEPDWDPGDLAWLLLTHAHIDHSGFLPRLGRYGFRGRILCTAATAELAQVLLRDSAHIQEEDAEWLNRKGLSKHKPALPLYDRNDVERILRRFEVRAYDTWFPLGSQTRARFRNAGHIIGSATAEVEVRANGRNRRILWSGDVGRFGMPLNPDPEPPEDADYVIVESTYGNRTHPAEPALAAMEPLLRRMLERQSILLVPAFAVGRAQQIVYMARRLIASGQLPAFPVYVDSPMAVDATEIYCKYPDNHTLAEDELLGDGCVLYGPNVHLVRSVEASKRLNGLDGAALLISSSGMLAGGRVLHHLKRLLPEPDCTVALVGYQAVGTRGRALQEGAATLKIHGKQVPVRAQVEDLGSLSGHADHTELLRWLASIQRNPERVFITHGEVDASAAFAAELERERGWSCVVPRLGEHFSLD